MWKEKLIMKSPLITGSTDGIGKTTALALAESGFYVIIHGRNRNKGKSVEGRKKLCVSCNF